MYVSVVVFVMSSVLYLYNYITMQGSVLDLLLVISCYSYN